MIHCSIKLQRSLRKGFWDFVCFVRRSQVTTALALPDSQIPDEFFELGKCDCRRGAKLSQGHVPLYCSGQDAKSKQFRSFHAVQRHMIDTNQCKMLYEGNEDEYEEYYDYSKQSEIEEGNKHWRW